MLQICLPQEGLLVSNVESMDIFHRCWPRRSTNLEAGGELASLAYQIDELKSQKLGQDQDWCITGA